MSIKFLTRDSAARLIEAQDRAGLLPLGSRIAIDHEINQQKLSGFELLCLAAQERAARNLRRYCTAR